MQVGAVMNDSMVSRHGMSPSIFPPGLPVYSGHYHKPHVVAGSSIEYIGSPMQMSFAEAGQEKRLLLLTSDWQVSQ